MAANSVAIANHFLASQSPPRVRLPVQEIIDKSFPWRYFDGAAQGDPSMCGAGAVLFLEEGHFFRARWGLGEGTNKQGKVIGFIYASIISP